MIRGLAVLAALAPAQAGAFDIAFPVDCTLGQTCFIQQYPDHDPTGGSRDFTCGPLTYDGHDGTDIALPTVADMAAGVDVLAAAPGIVTGVRSALPDQTDPALPPAFPEGQDCGNGLVIDHGDGWQTQYCHLRQHSITLTRGDDVVTGQPLGQIGVSGNSQFPHLHFTLRHNGTGRDPFAPALSPGACAAPAGQAPAWTTPIPYEAGGILGAGFAAAMPTLDAVKAGLPPTATLPADAPALILWVHLYGTRAGDRLDMVITGPDGPFADQTVTLDRTQARAFRATGRQIADRPRWPAGAYAAEARLTRDGIVIDRATAAVRVP